MLVVHWELAGQSFTGINGGPQFPFSEAISLLVNCDDQAEIDYFWEKLGEGGEHGPCGWLKDHYGVSWQIVPAELEELVAGPDAARSARAMEAMLGMGKLDLEALRKAAAGD